MNLYLVRHAEAAPKELDAERHLTAQGVQDAERLAQLIGPLNLRVEAIWHSPKPRAQQTAQALAPAAGSIDALRVHEGLLPFDRVKPIAKLLARSNSDLMIVGHDPFLSRLAARLLVRRASADIVELDKPSILCLTRDTVLAWRIAWLLSLRLFPQAAVASSDPEIQSVNVDRSP